MEGSVEPQPAIEESALAQQEHDEDETRPADTVLLGGWVLPDLDYPTFRLLLIAKVMDRLTLRRLTEVGVLTYAEWRVLSRLAMAPDGLAVGRLAELAWVDRAEVSRAATALERRGLIGRRTDPDDRRKPILHITDAGRDYYGPMAAERQRFHESLVTDLSSEERTTLDGLLTKIARRLVDTMQAPSDPPIDKAGDAVEGSTTTRERAGSRPQLTPTG